MSIELTVMSLDFDSDEPPNVNTYEKEVITLGRGPDNDVVLAGAEVSSKHAQITIKTDVDGNGMLYVTDLGSANGTLVDNIPLNPNEPKVLRKNERILISGYLIKPAYKSNGNGARAGAVNLNRTIVIDESSPLVNFQEELKAARAEAQAPEAQDKQESEPDVSEVAVEPAEVEPEQPDMSELVAAAAMVNEPSEEQAATDEEADEHGSLAAMEAFLDEEEEPSETTSPSESPPEVQASSAVEAPEVVVAAKEESDKSSSSETIASAVQAAGEIAGVAGSHEVLDLDFDIEPVAPITGQVLHKGVGLPDVLVSNDQGETVSTDSEGRFSLGEYVEGETFELQLEKQKFLIDGDSKGEFLDGTTLEFTARELFTIQGVIKSKGTPLPGVTVDGGPLGETVTDAEGRYVFKDVPEGTEFKIQPKKAGFKVRK